MELYPDIQVQLLLEDQELDLSMREADVAIRLRRPTQPDLIQRKLFVVHHHVYASTDYIKLFSEQIRPFVKAPYVTLGTDGFGRSDTREKLRHFFEVDRHWVTLAALKALADNGEIKREVVAAALVKYNLDPNKPNPMSV